MSYREDVKYDKLSADVTNIALVAPVFENDPPVVALLLHFQGRKVNAAWEGGPAEARQLAAALMNAADRVDEGAT